MSQIRSLEDLSSLERMALIPISYSRLSTFDMCQAKYFYSYIVQEPQQFGEAAVLGNILHSVLEETDFKESLSVPTLHQAYREKRYDYDPDSKISEKLINDGFNMLTEFVDRHKGDTFNVLASELPFSFVLGSAYINGFIDQVAKHNNRIGVIDFKSGRNEVTYKDVPNDLQLGIYALALSLLYPDEEVIRAELYYLRSGRRKGHDFTREELKAVEARLSDKINTLIETDNYKFTENVRVCSFCDFRSFCPVGSRRFPT